MSCTNSLSADELPLAEDLWDRGLMLPKYQRTIDTTIPILVRLSNHLFNLFIGELLSDGSHDMTELGG
jgi:hypothetical protein